MSRIKNPSLEWRGDAPFSTAFNDIYYSLENGLAETQLVFLHGNRLPAAWRDVQQFTIAETGFGTGLNFLAAWQLFAQTAGPGTRLDFISVEQFPLHRDDLQRVLQPWRGQIDGAFIDRLLAIYPPRIPGFHRRWLNDRVTLTLIFDDAVRAYAQVEATVDAWFLDGFSPAKNPQLWQAHLFSDIARLSHAETMLGSFTAAGTVRRGLEAVGFDITRESGFGSKRHRITGRFKSEKKKTILPQPQHATIIGAGFAGLAATHALQRRGVQSIIHERQAALGADASGNRIGLINPKIEAQDNPRNDAGLSAFSFVQHMLNELPAINYRRIGALHLAIDVEKHDRLHKIFTGHSWLEPHAKWVSAAESAEYCGIPLSYDGLFYAESGMVDNRKLLHRLAQDKTIHFNSHFDANVQNGLTILCPGWALHDLVPALPLQAVRGQTTYINAPLSGLRCPVMAGHYFAPLDNGEWVVGASFKQNDSANDLRAEEDAENLTALSQIIGIQDFTVTNQWAGIRTAARDRFPTLGPIPDQPNRYVLGALGSHGIQFSFLLAEILACQLTGAPLPIGRDALKTLSITRFWKNA